MTIQPTREPKLRQAAPLNGHHRRTPKLTAPTTVRENGTLPPADLLAAHGAPDELIAAVERFNRLSEAERDHASKAAAANAAADAARLDYSARRREALATGADPSSIKDSSEKHRKLAAEHLALHNEARRERAKLCRPLGQMLEDAATGMFATAEQRLDETAQVIRANTAVLREAWDSHGQAFEFRRWLSHVAYDGGTVGEFHGSTRMPQSVATAIASLDHDLAELDRLKHDEAERLRWQGEQG